MNVATLIAEMKTHPEIGRAGMILCHNGIVRETSRNGRRVTGLKVHVDENRLAEIISSEKRRPGIVDIRVHIAADTDLFVGDDVMLLAVAGDIREHVIAALESTLNAVKTTVTRKTEIFAAP